MTAHVDEQCVARASVSVLVVDDTPTLRLLTRLALSGTGFEVVGEAGDGLAGVNLAKRLRPDLVLLDLAMPVMDGLEALPLLRAALPTTRIVIVSGFDRKAMESQVIEAGADAYLQKGTPPDEMVDSLRRLFPAVAPPQPTAAVVAVPSPRTEMPDRVTVLEEEIEELLYVMSHDVAEPVHVIKGFAGRLARRAHSDEEAEFCEYILQAADRLQELLDDLLDYARAGQTEVARELLDCRRVVDAVLSGLGSSIKGSGARVTTGDLPRELVSSRFVLTQVLHNLVANALKFVTPGVVPQIRIDAEVTPGAVILRVQDNGIGIPLEQQERVFQPFKRLHGRDRYPGTGIGLAICRRLIERLGGRLWVESDGAAGGCTFCVEVPA